MGGIMGFAFGRCPVDWRCGWLFPEGATAAHCRNIGILVSGLAFDAKDETYRVGGCDATAISFLRGLLFYSASNCDLFSPGARHHKRPGGQHRRRVPGAG